MTASTPCPPVKARAQSATDWPSASAERLDPVWRQRLDAREAFAIARGAENAGHAAGKRGECGAKTERAGQPIDEDRLAGPGTRFTQSRVGGADIAKACRFFERHIVGKRHQIVLRRGDVFAHAAIGIGVELLLRIRPKAEIAAEGVVGAIHGVVGATGRAGAAEQTGINIDPVAFSEILHLIADRGDDAGDIQSENRRQFRQRQFRKPGLPMGQNVDQVGHDAARLDRDQHVRRPRCRHWHLLKPHRLANLMELGRKHRGHANSSPFASCRCLVGNRAPSFSLGPHAAARATGQAQRSRSIYRPTGR